MSGSSLDGLDVAIVYFEEGNEKWHIKSTHLIPYSEKWEQKLRNYHLLDAGSYIKLKYDYSHYIGELLFGLLDSSSTQVDCISFHGHTLIHRPENGYTEQIGNGAIVAAKTGVPTMTEFRNYDIALGGQGTPLAPLVDLHLFEGHDYYLNLGGIANITSVTKNSVVAYDICPCNQIFNHYAQLLGHKYDKDGELAKKGNLDKELHITIGKYQYFKDLPPKSLDNNWIRSEFIPSLGRHEHTTILHTYAQWMTSHIVDQVKTKDSSKMMVSGGGAHNTFLIELLKEKLVTVNCELILPSSEIIDFKEAILMAYLAKRYLNKKENILHSVTGAKRSAIVGSLHY